jgi:beta-glucosidase
VIDCADLDEAIAIAAATRCRLGHDRDPPVLDGLTRAGCAPAASGRAADALESPTLKGKVSLMTTLVDLVSRLDLPAKVRLLTGATTFTLRAEPAIGLAELRLSDGPTGVRGLKFSGGRVVSLFPNATLLAQAWSEDTAYEVGGCWPRRRWPRTSTWCSADDQPAPLAARRPGLRGVLGGSAADRPARRRVRPRAAGARRRRLPQAPGRERVRDRPQHRRQRARRGHAARALPAAVRDRGRRGRPWSVMAAYNDVNGVPATEQDHVINGILKGEWGWTGW